MSDRSDLNFFEGSPLDRAAHLRVDPEAVARIHDDPATLVVPVWRSMNLIDDPARPSAVVLYREEAETIVAAATETVFLGTRGDEAWIAANISHVDDPNSALQLPRGEFANIHRLEGILDREHAAILAHARGMAFWHERNQFCGRCGSATESLEAGYLRKCTNGDCGTAHFPRIDPAIIVQVSSGDHCLLGRQPGWPAGWYSTLAGFVEPGESLAEAVSREVYEESGVRVSDVRFHSSQPWPFPASLMVGFTARAPMRAPTIGDELEDVRWFSRAEVLAMRDEIRELRLPRQVSIARRLIEDWLAAGE